MNNILNQATCSLYEKKVTDFSDECKHAALKCLSDSIAQRVATTSAGQAYLCWLINWMISAKISRLTRDSLRHIQMNYFR